MVLWPRIEARPVIVKILAFSTAESFTRIMHEPLAATADMALLPGVFGSRTLRRTDQVRLRSEPLRLPGGTTISTISLRRLVHNAGYATSYEGVKFW
jgi:hypothetical protein